MKNKLITSSLLYTIGNLFIQGLAFITLPIYTRVISKEVFGQFNLYMAWVGLCTLFIGLQTGGSLSSAKVKYSEKEYNRYAVSAFTISNLFFVLFLLVAFLIKDYISSFFGLTSSLFLIMIVQSYATYISSFLGQYFIQQQKVLFNLALSAFSSLVNVALSIFLIYVWDDDFLARVLGNFVPGILVAVIATTFLYTRKEPILDKKYIPFIVTVSVPLIFHLLGHQLLNQLDRIMLGKIKTVNEVALYSFGYNVGLVIQIVLGSLNTAWVPWFFEARKSQRNNLSKIIHQYLSVGLFLTLGYLTIFPELANILGGKSYSGSHQFIALIVVSYFFVFLYTFPVNIQFYHANTKYIPIGTLFAAGVNFILNLVLIPNIGIYGAALATVLSYLSLLVFHHLVTKKLYNYKDVNISTYLFYSLMTMGYAILMTIFLHSLLIRWFFGLLVLVVFLFYYKNEVQFLVKKFITGGSY